MTNWFKNMKMQSKFLVSFMMIIVFSSMALIPLLYALSDMKSAAAITADESEQLILFETIRFNIAQQQLTERDFLLTHDASLLEYKSELDETIHANLEKALVSVESAEEAEEVEVIQGLVNDYEATFNEILALEDQGQQADAILVAREKYNPQVAQVNEQLEEMVLDSEEDAEVAIEDSNRRSQSGLMISGISVAISIIAGLAVSLFLTRTLTQPIAHLRNVAEKISLGELDLQVSVNQKDELGDLATAFERMIAAVRFFASEAAETESALAVQGD